MRKETTVNITVKEAVKICIDHNVVFAAYRMPNCLDPEMIIQKSPEVHAISSDDSFDTMMGFIVTPFSKDKSCKEILIEPDIYFVNCISADELQNIQMSPEVSEWNGDQIIPDEISYEEYIKQITSIIENIQQGTFEKVVLSRIKMVQGSYRKKASEIFDKLCSSYPNAFVYIFNIKTHLWVGATPEPLLRAKNGTMITVSLAGTRQYNEHNLELSAWNSKERLEQEYVSRYISKVLSRFNLKNIELEGPYTKKAGNLLHLRTDFSFSSHELKGKLGDFLNELHPTPAVCGMPRKASLETLSTLEKHNREYYSGFLGPIGMNDRISMFVNLRCMKVLNDSLALFVGGGITVDSKPDDEWQETEMKAETLLSIIKQV